jgi:hypothetical protein
VVLNFEEGRIAEDLALAAVRDFISEHGGRPTADSWTAAGMKPCERTIRNRFGSFEAQRERPSPPPLAAR